MNREIFAEYFEIIESSELFARSALSNNEETFLRSIRSIDDVLLFKDEISANPDLAGHITSRIDMLIDMKMDPKSLHPYDHAIAVYLYILSDSTIDEFHQAWGKVKEKKLTNLWWAYGIGSYLYRGALKTQIVETESAFDIDLSGDYNPIDEKEAQIKKSGDTGELKEGRYRDPGGYYA